jgi:hypothetical protein
VIQFFGPAPLYLYVLGMQHVQHRVVHLLKMRYLFFNPAMTVFGLMCKTRAVSRIPLAFIARMVKISKRNALSGLSIKFLNVLIVSFHLGPGIGLCKSPMHLFTVMMTLGGPSKYVLT